MNIRKLIRQVIQESVLSEAQLTNDELILAQDILSAFIRDSQAKADVGGFHVSDMEFHRRGDTESKDGFFDISMQYKDYNVALFGEFEVYGTATSSEQSSSGDYPGYPADVEYSVDVKWTSLFAYPKGEGTSLEIESDELPQLTQILPSGMDLAIVTRIKELVTDVALV